MSRKLAGILIVRVGCKNRRAESICVYNAYRIVLYVFGERRAGTLAIAEKNLQRG